MQINGSYVTLPSLCVSSCPTGQAPNANNDCAACDPSCARCAAAHDHHACTACPAAEVKNLLRLDKSCGAGCNTGAYLPNASATCAPCDASCRACSGPAATQCTKCTPPTLLVRGVCVTSTGANGDANITSRAEAQEQLNRVHDTIKKYAGAGKLDIGYKLGGTVQLTNNTDAAPTQPDPLAGGPAPGGDAGAPDPAVGAVQVLELVLVQGARGNYNLKFNGESTTALKLQELAEAEQAAVVAAALEALSTVGSVTANPNPIPIPNPSPIPKPPIPKPIPISLSLTPTLTRSAASLSR